MECGSDGGNIEEVFPPSPALNVSVVGLERALIQYLTKPSEEPFDIKTVPIETTPFAEMPKCMLLVCVCKSS